MEKNNTLRYEALAEILKALAHPTRLLITEVLSEKSCCVSELTSLVKADFSTVSKHLALMKKSGIIASEKMKNQVFYSLHVPCVMNFIGCIESVVESNAKGNIRLLHSLHDKTTFEVDG